MADPRAWGIEPGYHDVHGEWHDAPSDTVDAFLEVMGAESETPPGLGDDNPVWVVRDDETVRAEGRWELETEGGATLEVENALPELSLGYHWLTRLEDGRRVRLIVTPGRCHLPPDLRTWGWAVQLYALRSSESWGIGDLEDLRRLARWSRQQGAGMCLLNPLHAALPGVPQEPSPYFPSSRCLRNPLYLRVDGEMPGGLNTGPRIDRDAVWEAKQGQLEREFKDFGGSPSFDRYRAEQGEVLERYATYCAISEVHDRIWPSWPAELRAPGSAAVARFADEHEDRVRFHAWVQWRIDEQLSAAGSEIGLMQDVAIGVDPSGADAWMWQDVFALGVRVGAPPDEFNRAGQDWGLPPFDPWRLRMARYEPFVATVRAGFRHAGGLRFDHVMGLFRLFWIPPEGDAGDGTYVRYPHREMLDILSLESVRAGAYVVGEDLGTVEPEVRHELAARQVLSYRLVWFEDSPPSQYPEQALAAVTTHDLPTVAGAWKLSDPGEGVEKMRARLEQLLPGAADDVSLPIEDVVIRTHEELAQAPSRIVVATVEDALLSEQRPNMPGTTEPSNWSTPLPGTLEDLEASPLAARIAESLDRR
jgi:4-alpha-glucanotransferase